ncbi:MAG: hypothetical protein AB3N16_10385 [Flavobacteriaceae bacterium]
MLRNLFILLLALSGHTALGQKSVSKTMAVPKVSSVQVDAGNCFQVKVQTADINVLTVKARMDGEYNQDLLVSMEKEGNTLAIGAGFEPNFKHPNDKLSAHKVVSIELEITMPKHKYLQVFGTSSHVYIEGSYSFVGVVLNDGSCHLSQGAESVKVVTQSGHIFVTDPKGSMVANSKYGKVYGKTLKTGRGELDLQTVSGNIYIDHTK